MIRYTDTIEGIGADALHGFFEGWPNPPTPSRHLDLLRGSAHVWLAIDDDSGAVVGFVNALSDGVFAIAMTLLVFNIQISDLGEIDNRAEFENALASQLPHVAGSTEAT